MMSLQMSQAWSKSDKDCWFKAFNASGDSKLTMTSFSKVTVVHFYSTHVALRNSLFVVIKSTTWFFPQLSSFPYFLKEDMGDILNLLIPAKHS